ncbi:MAG: diguanylate cyclase [Nodosilinea sp. WJT8-NPBG4]|jgi:diguanylate cyclase (GGDEF)-like protein|nr:diguanylate cyclase [Nodosilinea sp. WJT8-NPBG4]
MQASTTRGEKAFQPVFLGWRDDLDLTEVADLITTQVRLFLGLDRVVIYRFDRAYNGQVIAEDCDKAHLPSLKGLHFPASDIPPPARAFLLKTRQRVIVNVAAKHKAVAVQAEGPDESQPDQADIRYTPVDPCHVQYLIGMGVLSSLTFSIVHRGKLWGLLVGHHSDSHQFTEFEIQTVQLWIDQLLVALAQDLLRQQVQQHQAREALRTKLSLLMGQESPIHDSWQKVLQVLAEDLSAAGCRLYLLPGGLTEQAVVSTYGLQPVEAVESREIWEAFCRILEPVKPDCAAIEVEPGSYSLLAGDSQQWANHPDGELLLRLLTPAGISSVLVVPIAWQDKTVGYLSLYRQTEVKESTWAGQHNPDPRNHYPRASFDAWKEQQRHLEYGEHWDLELAQLVGRHLSMELMQQWVKSRISGQADHDEMTQLPNWLLFHERLQISILQCLQRGKALTIGILNLDQFKRINQTYGHAFGNYLLKSIAHRLAQCLYHDLPAETDIETVLLARWHSDKFALLLPADGGYEAVNRQAQAVLDSLKAPFLLQGETVYLSGSLGVAIAPYDGNTADILIRKAETAMEQARHWGCGRYQLYDSVADTNNRLSHEKLANDLYRALIQQELILHYQPQIDARSGAVIGIEALVRWQHPQLGLVPPQQFIRIAEESGLICQLDGWVLRTACLQYQQWRQAGLPSLRLAVNITATQFQSPELVSLVQEVLYDVGMAATELELEITENTFIQDVQQAVTILRRLKGIGVQIALDDFGTGYSSMNALKHFPIDTLKIDRSFVRNCPKDQHDTAITRTVLALGHGLNLNVLAEGVETLEQVNWLREAGCDHFQGYYFSRPQPVSTMFEWLMAQKNCRSGDKPLMPTGSLPVPLERFSCQIDPMPQGTLITLPSPSLAVRPTTQMPAEEEARNSISITSMATVIHPTQPSHQLQQEQLIRGIAEKIRQSLHLEDILSTIVEEVRYLLDTDRVVLYQFSESWQGSIVQESAAPGIQTLIGHHIVDNCFAEKYVKYYRQGRVRAIEDIDTADIADCHRELLRGLDIRANLVVPVAYQDQLWGLLIAHHCRSPRLWDQSELDLLGQLAVQSAIAIHQGELYQRLELANHQLQKISLLDGLTQVANRYCFDQQLPTEWQRLQRAQAPLSLILCDIDYFKRYNDTYGHPAGDRCLQQVAKLLQNTVHRPGDLVARYGGEEFVVLLPETDLVGAKLVADRIEQGLKHLAIAHGESPMGRVTLSIGVAYQVPQQSSSPEALVRQADQWLYQAKSAGRNTIRIQKR